jgi:hypothetical protein
MSGAAVSFRIVSQVLLTRAASLSFRVRRFISYRFVLLFFMMSLASQPCLMARPLQTT